MIQMRILAQAAPDGSTWTDPKTVVTGIGILLAAVIMPMIFHILKDRRERENRIFAVRERIYTEYFKKYEDAAKGVGEDYEKFSRITLKESFRKLLEADNSPDAIIEFQDAIGNFPSKIQNSHRQATEEVTNIKILGSEDLLLLTSEFELLNQKILELSTDWLSEMKSSLADPTLDTPIAKEMNKLGIKIKEKKDAIIKQMRVELKLK